MGGDSTGSGGMGDGHSGGGGEGDSEHGGGSEGESGSIGGGGEKPRTGAGGSGGARGGRGDGGASRTMMSVEKGSTVTADALTLSHVAISEEEVAASATEMEAVGGDGA
eukprot:4232143-Prymnesium_polylepis.1